jgi:hypothetical protein
MTDLPTKPDKFTIMEIGREFCTLVMLLAVGWIAGRNIRERIAFAFISFGIWDIFYYVWLNVFIGWPASLFDWDILFLIPLPWWGPVWSPVLISVFMVTTGIIVVLKSESGHFYRPKILDWALLFAGILLDLYVFMEDAIRVYPQGIEAISSVRPEHFNIPLFLLGIAGIGFFCYRMSWFRNQA